MKLSGLYFITDSRLTRQGIIEDVKQVIEAGCRTVQYREKEKSAREMIKEAAEIGGICREKDVLFIVNNNVDIALAVNADGIHLGQRDMPVVITRKLLGRKKIIGVTVHSVEEALQAQKQGADYVSVSPIFHTDTKRDAGKPVGIQLIKEIKEQVGLPVVAIGGINEKNLQQVLDAGSDCIAMISAIVASDNVAATVWRIRKRTAHYR